MPAHKWLDEAVFAAYGWSQICPMRDSGEATVPEFREGKRLNTKQGFERRWNSIRARQGARRRSRVI